MMAGIMKVYQVENVFQCCTLDKTFWIASVCIHHEELGLEKNMTIQLVLRGTILI
jgi:hypothetical protein